MIVLISLFIALVVICTKLLMIGYIFGETKEEPDRLDEAIEDFKKSNEENVKDFKKFTNDFVDVLDRIIERNEENDR